jgi:tetratricopeptide (TPR) repeat protein
VRPRVSLCVIARNEAANLPACLQSAAGLVDETVVVDTGSTDESRRIAAELGAQVHDFPWRDDFAAARNETLRHATGDWVFWLDADDRLDQVNRTRLSDLFSKLKDENAGYVMRCISRTSAGNAADASVFDHVRLFRRQSGIRWRYRVHEQILPSLEEHHYFIHRAEVEIQHLGYQDDAAQARKLDRNLRLLELEDREHPNDAFVLFNLGQVYGGKGRLADAMSCYQRSLRLAGTGQSFVRKLFALLARTGRQLGQPNDAMRFCRQGLQRFPNDPELIFQEAWLLYLFGDAHGTETRFLQLLHGAKAPDDELAFGTTAGVGGYQTRHNLAVLYRDQQRFGEAEAQWRAALAEQPDFPPAQLGLGELYLGQARWREMEPILTRLEANPATLVEGAVLRSQMQLANGELQAAHQVLDRCIAAQPKALGPRIVLSRLLIQEGRDRGTIERALEAVLALDPNHAEARQNLAWVRQRR